MIALPAVRIFWLAWMGAAVGLFCMPLSGQVTATIKISSSGSGRTFEGVGGVSAGASSRLLVDYPDPVRGDILDYLFKPKFGAAFQHLKVEIGGGENSTCGSGAVPRHHARGVGRSKRSRL